MVRIMLACVIALVPLLAHAAPPPVKGEATPSPAAKTKAALDVVGTYSVENKSVTDTVEYFKARGKIDLQLDTAQLMMVGMDPATATINFTVKDGKLRDAINAAFSQYGLKLGVVGGTVVVSTEEVVIQKQLRQRVSINSGNLSSILKNLAEETGANVVLDPRQKKLAAEAQSELELTDVPLETAVRLASEVAGMKAVRMGNVLFVTSEARGEKLRADSDGPIAPVPVNPFMGGAMFDRVVPGLAVPAGPGGAVPPVQAVPEKP